MLQLLQTGFEPAKSKQRNLSPPPLTAWVLQCGEVSGPTKAYLYETDASFEFEFELQLELEHMSDMLFRPRVTAVKRTTEQYIDWFGAELYKDFCASLGIAEVDYWEWEAITRARGVDWWSHDLELEQINRLPPVEDYQMLVRDAHPAEASGPRRLYHYVTMRIKAEKLEGDQVKDMLLHELAGARDAEWYQGIVAHLG